MVEIYTSRPVIEINASNSAISGEANTASNQGGGQGLFITKLGVDLQFKTLIAGTGVSFGTTGTTLTINTSGSAWGGITGTLSDQTDLQAALDAKQTLDSTLTALAAYNTNGILVQTAPDTFIGRTIVAGTSKIVVTNGSGVAGNPSLTVDESQFVNIPQASVTNLVSDLASKLSANQLITIVGDANGSGTTSISLVIANDAVSFPKIQNISTGVLLGRSTAGSGDIEQITLGSGLTLSGGVLDASGSGSAVWGTITGTLSSQADLQAALDAKISTALTSTYFLVGNGSNVATPVVASQDATLDNAGAFTVTGLLTKALPALSTGLLKYNGSALIWDSTAYLTANQAITLSGDASGTGTTSIAVTLATVNSNIGTFNNVTVNGKGLVTAASNVSYLTANQTITLSGDTTGSGTTAITTTIPNDTVTFAKMQNINTARILGRSTASSGDIEELTLGANMTLIAGVLDSTGGGGGGTWGSITGTLSAQTDLQTALDSKWSLASGGTLTGANTITGTGQTLKSVWDNLGVTQTDGYGWWLANTTAATSGNQQISPSLVLEGQGWKTTATAGSQSVKIAQYVIPVQGTTNPTAKLAWGVSVNGGAYTNALTYSVTSGGGSPALMLNHGAAWSTGIKSSGADLTIGALSGGTGTYIDFVGNNGSTTIARFQGSSPTGYSSIAFNSTTTTNASVFITAGAYSSGWKPTLMVTPGAHTAMTAATEFVSNDFQGATQTWIDGTVATQRFNYFRGFTLNKTTTSATFTNAYTVYIDASTAGTGVTISGNYALGLGGNMFITGASGGSAILTVANNSSNAIFRVLPTYLQVGYNSAAPIIAPSNDGTSASATGVVTAFIGAGAGSNTFLGAHTVNVSISHANTTASASGGQGSFKSWSSFAPSGSSNTVTFSAFEAVNTINMSAGSGNVYGVNIKPTYTAARGDAIGYNYDPTVTSITGVNYAFRATSGSVLIGGTTLTNSSVILDLQSTTQALLVSRMSTFQKTGLTAVEGMVLYDSTLTKVQVYQGGAWVSVGSGGGGGITNSAVANELMKSDGTNAVTSGLFVTTNGNITLGSTSIAGDRTIKTSGSDITSHLFITAKDGASATNAGSNVTLTGGTGNTSGGGGGVYLYGGTPGTTGAGGAIIITGGIGGSTSGAGGTVQVIGGAGGSSGQGGSVAYLTGGDGYSTGNSSGGGAQVKGGIGYGSSAGGNAVLQGGAVLGTGAGGNASVVGGVAQISGTAAGLAKLIGGDSLVSAVSGGDAWVIGGAASSGNTNGGHVMINGGAPAGTGKNGSIGLFTTTANFGGGEKVVYIANAATVPGSNPTGGGILYAEGGALKYRGSSGTITTLAAA